MAWWAYICDKRADTKETLNPFNKSPTGIIYVFFCQTFCPVQYPKMQHATLNCSVGSMLHAQHDLQHHRGPKVRNNEIMKYTNHDTQGRKNGSADPGSIEKSQICSMQQ